MPRKYIKTGKTPEGTARRMRAFYHNSFTGYVAMSTQHMRAIQEAETTTMEAKRLAHEISLLLSDLHRALKTRVDPPE